MSLVSFTLLFPGARLRESRTYCFSELAIYRGEEHAA